MPSGKVCGYNAVLNISCMDKPKYGYRCSRFLRTNVTCQLHACLLYLILPGDTEDASSGVAQLIQTTQNHRK